MSIYYTDDQVKVHHGDCLDVLKTLPDNSIDAVVTDPPYGLEFMGKDWDKFSKPASAKFRNRPDWCGKPGQSGATRPDAYHAGAPFQSWCTAWATECLRVLKPGGHMLAFGGTRTFHRLACAIEDAGFEIRDSIAWLYGSGFPKSLDVSKQIDKAAGAKREVVGSKLGQAGYSLTDGNGDHRTYGKGLGNTGNGKAECLITAPVTDAAKQWAGWGTALKPSHEPLVVARKPAGMSDILAMIGSQLDALENLWQARDSDPITRTGAAVDSSAATATSASESTAATFLSTVMSWRNSLADLCSEPSMSTIATRSSTITDLKTLSSWLAQITRGSTTKDQTSLNGLAPLVLAADNLFASVVFASRATLARSAGETATDATPTEHQGAAEPDRGAFEPIVVARKPIQGTVAANVIAHGTGALNIDGCRVATSEDTRRPFGTPSDHIGQLKGLPHGELNPGSTLGRWPPNVVLDGYAATELDKMSGTLTSGSRRAGTYGLMGYMGADVAPMPAVDGDSGGASRYFPVFKYTPKAPSTERPTADGVNHPTVKPVELMRWLIRLITPPGGTVLDLFAGTGTTGEAAIHEHMHAILIEREPDYLPLIVARLSKPMEIGFNFEEPA